MKKLSFILIIMMVMLSACSKTNQLFDIDYQTYSSKNLKFVTEKGKYSTKDTVIRYSVTNISDSENCIAGDDDCFTLHIRKEGEWKSVGTKVDHYWNELALILEPGQTVEREIRLEDYYNLPLEKGEYQICMESIVSNSFEIS